MRRCDPILSYGDNNVSGVHRRVWDSAGRSFYFSLVYAFKGVWGPALFRGYVHSVENIDLIFILDHIAQIIGYSVRECLCVIYNISLPGLQVLDITRFTMCFDPGIRFHNSFFIFKLASLPAKDLLHLSEEARAVSDSVAYVGLQISQLGFTYKVAARASVFILEELVCGFYFSQFSIIVMSARWVSKSSDFSVVTHDTGNSNQGSLVHISVVVDLIAEKTSRQSLISDFLERSNHESVFSQAITADIAVPLVTRLLGRPTPMLHSNNLWSQFWVSSHKYPVQNSLTLGHYWYDLGFILPTLAHLFTQLKLNSRGCSKEPQEHAPKVIHTPHLDVRISIKVVNTAGAYIVQKSIQKDILRAIDGSTSVANFHIYCVSFGAWYCNVRNIIEKCITHEDVTHTDSRSYMLTTILLSLQSIVLNLKILPWDIGFSAAFLVPDNILPYCLLSTVSFLWLIAWVKGYRELNFYDQVRRLSCLRHIACPQRNSLSTTLRVEVVQHLKSSTSVAPVQFAIKITLLHFSVFVVLLWMIAWRLSLFLSLDSGVLFTITVQWSIIAFCNASECLPGVVELVAVMVAAKIMKDVSFDKYGGGAAGLKYVEVPIPGPNKGEMVEAGPGFKNFKVGDKVVALLSRISGGGLAEYAVASQSLTVQRPPKVSAAEAAGLPVAPLTTLQAITKSACITLDNSGKTGNILITAASGGVGHYAVQLAKLGNTHVSATCARNIEFVKSLGADKVIDYKTSGAGALNSSSGKKYDAVFHCASGTPWSTF